MRAPNRRVAIAHAAILIAFALFPRTLSGQASRVSHQPISAEVLASWHTRGDILTLLVLWRGTPGWWFSGTQGGALGGSVDGREFQQIREGGLTFQIDYDITAGTASLLDHTVSLNDVNVVFVDNVDGPAGPAVVATRFVDPTLPPGEHDAPLVLFRREPELYEFLRCKVALPALREPAAPLADKMVTTMCASLRPR